MTAVGVIALLIGQTSLVWRRAAALPASRRYLMLAFSATMPLAGPLLGLLGARIRGTGQVEQDLRPPEERPTSNPTEDVRRIGPLPALLDRLLSDDANERLAALVTLSHRGDAEAVSLLRWTIERGASSAALDAVLTLDEMQLDWERQLEETVAAVKESQSFDRALGAANLSADGILKDLADPAMVRTLVASAREYYQLALSLDPSRELDVGLRRAELELRAGSATEALDMLDRLRDHLGRSAPSALLDLRSRARFAARRKASRQIGFTMFAGGATQSPYRAPGRAGAPETGAALTVAPDQ